MTYILVSGSLQANLVNFTDNVNARIADGYAPLGPPIAYPGQIFQAMVLVPPMEKLPETVRRDEKKTKAKPEEGK